MSGSHSHEQERELVSILLESAYYLDLGLVERYKLLRYLLDSFLGPGGMQKAA